MLFDISLSRLKLSSCRNKYKRVPCSLSLSLSLSLSAIYWDLFIAVGLPKEVFPQTQNTHNNTAKSIKFTLSTFIIGVISNFLRQENGLIKDRLRWNFIYVFPYTSYFYEALFLLLSIIFMYHNEMQKLHIMKINLIISTFHQIISTCPFIRVVIESCYI